MVKEKDPVFKALQDLGFEETKKLRDLLLKTIRNIPEGKKIVDYLSQHYKP